MAFIPARPTGSTREARFDQATWDATYGPANRIRNSSTVKWSRTTKGLIPHAAPPAAGGGNVVPYVITTLKGGGDFFLAKLWNPSSETAAGSEVRIAKCITGRQLALETIDGVLFTYEYAGDNFRTQFKDASIFEYQVCHERYRVFNQATFDADGQSLEEALIYATRVARGSGVLDENGAMITLAEVSPQRHWAFQYNQTGPPP
jgi:hypothetical protein